MSYTQPGKNLDAKSEAFLLAVYEHGGEATTTQILQRTGLTQDERNYRFRKLREMGLIGVTQAEKGTGNRDPPKIAHLTADGEGCVEKDDLSDDAYQFLVDTEWNDRFNRHEERLDRIENTLARVNNRLDSLEQFRNYLKNVLFPEQN